jgi:hypothetical protein
MSTTDSDNVMPICVEDFSDDILLRRVLTPEEKQDLCTIILHTLHHFTDSPSSRAYAWNECQQRLSALVADLEAYFNSNQRASGFLRLSSLSPKDAYFVLEHQRFFSPVPQDKKPEEEEEEEEQVTLDELKRELAALRVTTPYECMMLLCHSYRTFIDLEHDETRTGNALLLLPWRGDNFFHARSGGTCASRACKRAGPFPPFTPQVMLSAARAARISKEED